MIRSIKFSNSIVWLGHYLSANISALKSWESRAMEPRRKSVATRRRLETTALRLRINTGVLPEKKEFRRINVENLLLVLPIDGAYGILSNSGV